MRGRGTSRLLAALISVLAILLGTAVRTGLASAEQSPKPASPAPSAATAGQPAPGLSKDPAHHDSIAPGYWLPLLEAPITPLDYRPAPGPRLSWPTRGFQTQPFGCTNLSLEPQRIDCPGGFHDGLDLADPTGTPVRAAAAGIAYPMPDYQYYGNHVLLQHQAGLATVYGHLFRMNVTWGQAVSAGDVIGWVGSTGNSTGPHLHFEVRFAGTPVDPLPYLSGSPPDPFPLTAGWPGMPPDDYLGFN